MTLNAVIEASLDQTAIVYTADSNTGRYTTSVNSSLACRLLHIPLNRAQRQQDRAELAGMRHMMFDPTFVMDEHSQIDVDGVRWEPLPGSFGAFRDWHGVVIYRSCDILRQD